MEDLKETPQEEQKNPTASETRASRGDIGPHNVKGLYHSFQRREGRKAKHITLKKFAHSMVEENNALGLVATEEEQVVVLDWFKAKAEQKRSR